MTLRTLSDRYPTATTRVAILLAWIATTVALIFFADPPNYPSVYFDEICRLSWARWFAGGSFYAMGAATYCQPVYPILLAPIFLIFNAPHSVSEAVFFINSGIAAASIPLTWILARDHFKASSIQAGLVAALVVIYPALTLHSHHAWPEPALYPGLLLAFTVFCRWIELRNWRAFLYLALVSVLLYGLHRKMIVFPLALISALFISLFIFRDTPYRMKALLTTLLLIGAIYLFEVVRLVVMAKFWDGADVNLIDRVVDQPVIDFISSILIHATGALLYGAIVTGGLLWLTLAYSIRQCTYYGFHGIVTKWPYNDMKWAFATGILVLLIGLSSFFVSTIDRFDAWFYGRHINAALVLNIVVGYFLVSRFKIDATTVRVAVAIAMLAFLVLALGVPGPPWADYSPIHVIGAAPFMDFLHSAVNSREFLGRLAALTAGTLLASLAGLPGTLRYLGLAPLAAFTFVTHIGTAPFKGTPPEIAFPPEIRQLLGSPECDILWDSRIREREGAHQFWRLQYHFPSCRIESVSRAPCDYSDRWIITKAQFADCGKPIETYFMPHNLVLLRSRKS